MGEILVMSVEDYKMHPWKCPMCRSVFLVDDSKPELEDDGSQIIQKQRCADCGATWKDVFLLDGYDELEAKK